jgi:hypothetical protein
MNDLRNTGVYKFFIAPFVAGKNTNNNCRNSIEKPEVAISV